MMIYSEKNANIRGKRWNNGEKGEIFIVPGGKINFMKKRVGQKYPILGKYITLQVQKERSEDYNEALQTMIIKR